MLATLMVLSSINVVFAAEVPTLTIGDVDATAVATGGFVVVPVTIDKLPEGKLNGIQLDFTFDKTKLEFSRLRNKDQSGNASMQIWVEDPDFPEDSKFVEASAWVPVTGDNLTAANENGKSSASYIDTTKTLSFTAKSLEETNVLIYLYFKKLEGASGTTTVDFSEAKLVDIYSGSEGVTYAKSRNEVIVEPSTITFTAGPKDVKKVVGYYTGDKLAENDNADTTDTTAAVYAELNGDANTNYKKVNWTVTVDETEGKYTQAVDVTGEATYKFGLVIRGLAANVITAVDAALAQ